MAIGPSLRIRVGLLTGATAHTVVTDRTNAIGHTGRGTRVIGARVIAATGNRHAPDVTAYIDLLGLSCRPRASINVDTTKKEHLIGLAPIEAKRGLQCPRDLKTI